MTFIKRWVVSGEQRVRTGIGKKNSGLWAAVFERGVVAPERNTFLRKRLRAFRNVGLGHRFVVLLARLLAALGVLILQLLTQLTGLFAEHAADFVALLGFEEPCCAGYEAECEEFLVHGVMNGWWFEKGERFRVLATSCHLFRRLVFGNYTHLHPGAETQLPLPLFH